MQVSKLLELDKDLEIIAGKDGLDKNIETVSVMDAPDIYRWMKGGELLVTSGYVINQNQEKLSELILLLNEANISGLGIKIERYLFTLPEEIIDLCDEINLPLIAIPKSYAFADMINMVLTEILDEKTEKLELSRDIHQKFTSIVINGYSVQKIINVLSQLINKEIEYRDIFFDENYYSDIKDTEVTHFETNENNIKIEIEIGSSLLGYLIVYNDSSFITDEEKIAIEHASTVLKLEMQKKISNHRTNRKYLDQFVQDIILNNIPTHEEMDNRYNIYNIQKNVNGLISVIIDIDHYQETLAQSNEIIKINKAKERIFNIAKNSIKSQMSDRILHTSFSDQLVLLIEPINVKKCMDDLLEVLNDIKNQVNQKTHFTVTIGVGNYKEDMMEAHHSYSEAREAVKSSRFNNNNNTIVLYEKTWYYSILNDIAKSQVGLDFLENHLKELEYYDKEHNANLIDTLEVLIENNWNYKQTSKKLFLHYNTIKYRVGKIESILDIDLKNSNQRFQLQLYFTMKSLTSK